MPLILIDFLVLQDQTLTKNPQWNLPRLSLSLSLFITRRLRRKIVPLFCCRIKLNGVFYTTGSENLPSFTL